ncbi:MAG: hypothetical protein RL885_01585 [Planctomycetota bacterium]
MDESPNLRGRGASLPKMLLLSLLPIAHVCFYVSVYGAGLRFLSLHDEMPRAHLDEHFIYEDSALSFLHSVFEWAATICLLTLPILFAQGFLMAMPLQASPGAGRRRFGRLLIGISLAIPLAGVLGLRLPAFGPSFLHPIYLSALIFLAGVAATFSLPALGRLARAAGILLTTASFYVAYLLIAPLPLPPSRYLVILIALFLVAGLLALEGLGLQPERRRSALGYLLVFFAIAFPVMLRSEDPIMAWMLD